MLKKKLILKPSNFPAAKKPPPKKKFPWLLLCPSRRLPINQESKQKGKAAIDGVGSRLGKSGGSVIHQSLLLIFSTVAASTPYAAVIFFIVVVAWIFSAVSLGKQFDSLTKPSKEPVLQ